MKFCQDINDLINTKTIIYKINRRSRVLLGSLQVKNGRSRCDVCAKISVENLLSVNRYTGGKVLVVDYKRRNFIIACWRSGHGYGGVAGLKETPLMGRNIDLPECFEWSVEHSREPLS